MNPLRAALNFYEMRSSWFGDGGQPVPQALANARSAICLSCPKNQPHPIWELITVPARNQLRRQLELKAKMRLAVPGESGLRVCDACLCYLPLKVFTPLRHVLATTELGELDARCWIREEAKQ